MREAPLCRVGTQGLQVLIILATIDTVLNTEEHNYE